MSYIIYIRIFYIYLWAIKIVISPKTKKMANHQSSVIYGMAFIGAAIYFIKTATTFWMGVLGFLKAIVWPAILVYKLLEFFKL